MRVLLVVGDDANDQTYSNGRPFIMRLPGPWTLEVIYLRLLPICISLWQMSDLQPDLKINYSRDFSLTIQFSHVDDCAFASSQYFFDVTCQILHPTGQFAYTGLDICFDPQMFHRFAGQLDAIGKGRTEIAELREVGGMIIFSVEIRGRDTRASVRIREYQPDGEETLLSAGFHVDYDLFVNALRRSAVEFCRELAKLEPT